MPQHKDLKIFISYRRADNPCFAERIRDWFSLEYERENVFMDFDAIPPFVDFSAYILDQIRKVDVMLAIIGPQWMRILDERRQSGETDYVRIEIATALKMGKLVAPILIDDTPVPDADDLPDDMREMMRFNAARLRGGRQFLDNIEVLIDALPLAIAQNNRVRGAAPQESLRTPVPESVKQADRMLDSASSLRSFTAERGLALLPGGMPPGMDMAIDAAENPPAPAEAREESAGSSAAALSADNPGAAPIVIACNDADYDTGSRLAADLESHGYSVALTTRPQDTLPEDTRLLLVVLSPGSKRSPTVHHFVWMAHDQGLPVMPVIVAGDTKSAVPYVIAANDVSDLTDYDAALPGFLDRVAMYTN